MTGFGLSREVAAHEGLRCWSLGRDRRSFQRHDLSAEISDLQAHIDNVKVLRTQSHEFRVGSDERSREHGTGISFDSEQSSDLGIRHYDLL
jgi:hypothetical protein